MSTGKRWLRTILTVIGLVGLVSVPIHCYAQQHMDLPDGSKLDLASNCPVCGMRIGGDMGGAATYAYRDNRLLGFAGVAAAVFRDGTVVGFEGARCLFIYNTVPKRFGIDVENISNRYVTDFTSRKLINVQNAFLVLGSRVKGPMGYDLIAFSSVEEAEKFRVEHGGKRVVQLHTVGLGDVDREKKPLEKKP